LTTTVTTDGNGRVTSMTSTMTCTPA
jgi:hypothetical protein